MVVSSRSNDELLQRLEQRNPLQGLGCSYSPHPIRLWIHDMKKAYVDLFRFASKHVHFLHYKARSRLPAEIVAKVEEELRSQIVRANEAVDEAIVQAEFLMKAQGITISVTDAPNCSAPLCHVAEIISPLTNRYIQLIEKTDYLLRAFDLLFQQEVISVDEYNRRRGQFKKSVKSFYYACRRVDEGLRARMNAEAARATRGPVSVRSRSEQGNQSPTTAIPIDGVGLPTAASSAAPVGQLSGGQIRRSANSEIES